MIDFMDFKRNRYLKHDPKKDIRQASYVVLDTELTGLDEKKDSIVSIGAVRMSGGRITAGETFYKLINPEAQLTARSVVIHQIVPSEVSEKPTASSVLSEFFGFCKTDILVGFCVSIDMEFLSREAKRFLGVTIRNHVIDILPIYEWVRKRQDCRMQQGRSLPARYSLYDIARFYDIEVGSAHNAMMDAYITAQIFQRCIPILVEAGITSVGDLMKLSDRLEGGDRLFSSRNTCSL